MLMKTYFLLLATFFSVASCFAQGAQFDWVNAHDNALEGLVYSEHMDTDADANVYTAGLILSGSGDLDPGSGTTPYVATRDRNEHISKYASDGNYQWSSLIGYSDAGSSSLRSELADIEVSDSGYVYVCGSFNDTLFYETGSGTQWAVSNGYTDIFFGKLSPNGEFLWMKTYGDVYDDKAGAIAISPQGDIYLTGYYSESVTFIPGGSTYYADWSDLFVLKFDRFDNEEWVYSTENPGLLNIFNVNDLVVNQTGEVFVGGTYIEYNGDSVNFQEIGNPPVKLPSYDLNGDGFLLKLDSAGGFTFVRALATNTRDQVTSLLINSNNHLILSGYTGSDSIDFDPGTLADSISWSAFYGVFLVCYDESDNFKWVKEFSPTGAALQNEIYLTHGREGQVHCLATFNGDVDVDPSSADEIYSTFGQSASFSAYSLTVDSLGNYVWSYHYNTNYGGEYGYGITSDDYGNVYGSIYSATSNSADSLVFGDSAFYTSTAGGAVYTFKLSECGSEIVLQLNDSTLMADATNVSYQWVNCDSSFAILSGDTNRVFTATYNGNYALISTGYACTDTSECFYLDVNGCLTTPVDTLVLSTNAVLTANQAGATYQWLDCDSGYLPIAGETNQSFTPSVNGNYAVLISEGMCSDTSSCYAITGVGIEDLADGGIAIYPNPVKDRVTVESEIFSMEEVQLFDMQGRLADSWRGMDNRAELDVGSLKAGMYVLRIVVKNGSFEERITKM